MIAIIQLTCFIIRNIMAKKTTSINEDIAQVPSFEASMQELEQIVNRLESGELPLEEALNEFEHGVRLARVGQKTLQDAEQRVRILLKEDDNSAPDEFIQEAE